MNETIIILLNMRGSCATVGEKVHALFRVNNRLPKRGGDPDRTAVAETCERASLAEPEREP